MGFIEAILIVAVKSNASDVHITVGVPPTLRINGTLKPLNPQEFVSTDENIYREFTPADTEKIAQEMMRKEQYQEFITKGEYDFPFIIKDLSRFRVNTFKQQGCVAIAIRVIKNKIPSIEDLGFPQIVSQLARRERGLVLVTGPTGSGKSTTLAAMIDLINTEYTNHIITLEDPIEYLHRHKKSLINQRELGQDTQSFAAALRAAMREDPDVILVGEMRDLETISIAITAAETGHLVLATLHTTSAPLTIDRIIDVFPPYQQQQIKMQLSGALQGVICQQLLPRQDGSGRVAAIEVMVATPAIRNLIREGKTHQILSQLQTGAKFGMQTMEMSIKNLLQSGLISKELMRENSKEI